MISELGIDTYRGIKGLKLDNLGKINIIAGANNTGKTSILEVLQSLEAPNDFMNWRRISRRELLRMPSMTTPYESISALFPVDMNNEENMIKFGVKNSDKWFEIEIKASKYKEVVNEQEIEGNLIRSLRRYDEFEDEAEANLEYETDAMELEYILNGNKFGVNKIYSINTGISDLIRRQKIEEISIIENVVYISPTQHAQNMLYFDALFKEPELYEKFVEVMKQFDPDFISIHSFVSEMGFGRKYMVLSKNHKTGLLLNAYGDGMKKAMLLISAVLQARNGILLLDEFETAIHVSAMKSVFELILETAAKYNVQVFMTSHSIEAIKTVLECCPDLRKEIRMITLVKVDEQIKARNVDGEKAIQLSDEFGLELR